MDVRSEWRTIAMTKDDRIEAEPGRRHVRTLLVLGAGVLALGAVGWAGLSWADPWHGRGMGPMGWGPAGIGWMMLDQLDADGDGVVGAAELQRPSDRMFMRMDRDGDGYLTPMSAAERERMRERMREHGRERGPGRD